MIESYYKHDRSDMTAGAAKSRMHALKPSRHHVHLSLRLLLSSVICVSLRTHMCFLENIKMIGIVLIIFHNSVFMHMLYVSHACSPSLVVSSHVL